MKKLLAFALTFLLAGPVAATDLQINNKALHASISRAFAPMLMQLGGSYSEDSAHVSGHFGSLILGVRRDTPTSLAGADNDYMPLTFNSVGALWVAGNGTFTVGDGAGALNVIVDSITAFPDNEPFNVAQINGVTPLMGNGVTGTGSPRVTIASDNTPVPVSGTVSVTEPVSVDDNAGSLTVDAVDLDIRNLTATDVVSSDEITTADLDPGAGTDTHAVVGLRIAKSAGSALVGAGADGDPVPISDDGGSVTVDGPLTDAELRATPVPVSGTVTANAGTNLNTSALLTTAAHDAALGTAGTADAQVRTVQGVASMTPLKTQGDVAHDGVDAGEPVKIGHKAVAHDAQTEVAAGDRTDGVANRDGVSFVIGGNPGIVTETATVLDADGAQTGAAIHTVAAGTIICVTQITVTCSAANTVSVEVRVAFDTDTTLAAKSTTGTVGILLEHGGVAPGGGAVRGSGSGLLACGADDEDLRYSLADPVGDECAVTASYYESAS